MTEETLNRRQRKRRNRKIREREKIVTELTCTSKSRYETELEAFKSTAYQSMQSGKRLTYYLCPFCTGYHMTSDTTWKKRKENIK